MTASCTSISFAGSRDKEMERLKTLGEEFQKRDMERENLMKQKVRIQNSLSQ